jgi:hypothetical protein
MLCRFTYNKAEDKKFSEIGLRRLEASRTARALRYSGAEPTGRAIDWNLARGCLMARLESSRCSFNPEALSQIALIVDDVWKELSTEGAYDASLGSGAGRTYVARKVFQLAQAEWSAIQIKQLLLRALRNEISLRRRETSARA